MRHLLNLLEPALRWAACPTNSDPVHRLRARSAALNQIP
jgi:hypothetical protein